MEPYAGLDPATGALLYLLREEKTRIFGKKKGG
jgi:hypothetical protein